MRPLFGAVALLALYCCAMRGADAVPGDSARGEELLRTKSCIACHDINGDGARSASNLGNRVARGYSPSILVSVIWNHGRTSWPKLINAGAQRPRFTEAQMADLFAYAIASRYFEKPGDAGRGRQVFVAKRCAECHGINSANPGGARPVAQWDCLTDPMALASEMWDHAPKMVQALRSRDAQWAQLTAQELTDLLVYLRNLPRIDYKTLRFSGGSVVSGRKLFEAKGCGSCHDRKVPLEARNDRLTTTDFVASMWNHALTNARSGPSLSHEEMREIFGYLWSLQLFSDRGDPRRGARVFAKKGCASCHSDPSIRLPGPKTMTLQYRATDPIAISAALLSHQPHMVEAVEQRSDIWPKLSGADMADVVAFLWTNQFSTGDSRFLSGRR